jgi:nucleotide-binding universal stress UspA family protein
MFQRQKDTKILVPLDGSPGSERAIPVAARIARASSGSIIFIRVEPPPVEVGTFGTGIHGTVALKPEVDASEKFLADATGYLEAITIAYADDLQDLATETDVATGAASPTIFSAARLEEIDLIVMCSHGKTGLKRWILGSVAQQAVRHSSVPILILNEHGMAFPAPDAAHPLRILVTLDGSALSEAALEPAAQLLAAWTTPQAQGELHLLRVVDLPPPSGKFGSLAIVPDSLLEETRQEAETYVKAVADRLSAGPLAGTRPTITSSVTVSTDVAGTILKQAENAELTGGYSLIAMATHGRSGLKRLVMGSVTEHVLEATTLPLLIVRPSATIVKGEEEGATTTAEGTAVEEQAWVGLL